VITHEKSETITLGQLTLSVRIDRVDQLSDGKKFIIDYKTSKHHDINQWFSDRPEEPQLPLYALLDPDKTAGIAFAQLVVGDNTFKGISLYSMDIKGIKTLDDTRQIDTQTWPEQIAQWHHTLSALSEAFASGKAIVDPKEPPETCKYCKLKPLCRIHEEVCHD
jgi:hypothetical protein